MTDKELVNRLNALRWQVVGLYSKLARGHHRALIANCDDALCRIISDYEAKTPRLVEQAEGLDIPNFLRPQAD